MVEQPSAHCHAGVVQPAIEGQRAGSDRGAAGVGIRAVERERALAGFRYRPIARDGVCYYDIAGTGDCEGAIGCAQRTAQQEIPI